MDPNCVDVSRSVVVDGCVSALLSSAAEVVEGSEDLLKEILSRVPVKPLCRFKCVSKWWFSLISDPDFRRRHTLRHPTTRASGIFLRGGFEFASLSGNNHRASPIKSFDLNCIEILQSCNGLLLCSTPPRRYLLTPMTPPPPHNRKYFMYNPTTKHSSVLPAHPTDNVELNLAFDPTRSPNYTVVCVRRIFYPSDEERPFFDPSSESRRFYEIKVYSSEAEPERRAWRPCGSSFYAPTDMDFQRGVYYNGAVHWFGSKRRVSLFRFDLSQECLSKYNLPPLPRGFFHFVAAAACGHLHLVEECFTDRNFRVLRLERDYSRCVLMYNVDLTQLGKKFPDMLQSRMPLSLVQGESNEEDPSLLLHLPGKVILLCLKDNTFSEICDLVLDPSDPSSEYQTLTNWYHTYDYCESLACV